MLRCIASQATSFKTTERISVGGYGLKINIRSQHFYYNIAGYAWFFNETQPTSSFTSYWDVYIEGIYAQPGIGSFPSSVNTSGAIAIGIRAMTFSKFEVRKISGFDYKAIEFDCMGLSYPSNNQVIQHNTFIFGQIANNGYGIWALSENAENSGFQGNRIEIQNIYQNHINICDGDATYKASTSNTWVINAMDNETAVGFDSYSPFNDVYIGFTGNPGTSIRVNNGSDFNKFHGSNNTSTDVVINYNGGGKNNKFYFASPSSLPGSQTPVSGTNYANGYGCPISVVVPVTGSGSVEMIIVDQMGNSYELSSVPISSGQILTFPPIHHGWSWKVFTLSGSITYGTALIFAA